MPPARPPEPPPAPPSREPAPPRASPLATAALLLLALLPYLNALRGDFLYDDFPYVVENPQVQQPTFERLFLEPLTGRPELGLHRPLPVASYALQAQGRGADAPSWPFHAGNVLLHAATTIVAWRLLLRMRATPAAAWLAAALFAVHPCHVEAIDWIVGRAELLAALFGFAFLLVGLRAPRRPRDVALAALLYAAASLSKESAFVLPAVLFVLERTLRPQEPLRAALLRQWPWAATLALLLLLRVAAMGTLAPAIGLAPYRDVVAWKRPLLWFQLLGEYFWRALVPSTPRLFFHESEFVELRASALIGGAAWLAALVGLRRHATLRAALLAFPVALLTVLNVRPIQETFAERFLYLPSLFALLLPASGLAALLERERRRSGRIGASLAAPAATLVLLAGFTLHWNPIWDSALRLWRHNVALSPDLPFLHYQYAYFLHQRGLWLRSDAGTPGAIEEYEKALDCHARVVARGYRGMPPDQQARAWLSIGSIWLLQLPPERRSAAHAKRALEQAIAVAGHFTRLDAELARALGCWSLLRHHDVGVDRDQAEQALRRALAPELKLPPELKGDLERELAQLLAEKAAADAKKD